jgi:16S rRNA processing protein RimM
VPAQPDDLVVLGVIARPHGVSGELRAHPYNPDSTLLYERDAILVRHEGAVREVAILRSRKGSKGAVLLTLDGITGREAADAMRGAELCVRREELPPAGEGEWYYVDLVGLEARDGEGRRLGEVTAVVPYPSVECLRVEAEDGAREVPITDDWVIEVDVNGGRVVIRGFDELPVEGSRR